MPHELKGIERMPAAWHGQILLLSFLSALVIVLLVWYLTRQRKGPAKETPPERSGTRGRSRRKGASR
jgi:hypothetical protein